MIKQSENYPSRGWEALKKQMQDDGFSSIEIDEAEESFRNGIQMLAKLFYSTYPVKHARSSKRINNL